MPMRQWQEIQTVSREVIFYEISRRQFAATHSYFSGGKEPGTHTETAPGVPAYFKMYEVAGQNSITARSFERYQKNKEQDAQIVKEAQNPTKILFGEAIVIQKVQRRVLDSSEDP